MSETSGTFKMPTLFYNTSINSSEDNKCTCLKTLLNDIFKFVNDLIDNIIVIFSKNDCEKEISKPDIENQEKKLYSELLSAVTTDNLSDNNYESDEHSDFERISSDYSKLNENYFNDVAYKKIR